MGLMCLMTLFTDLPARAEFDRAINHWRAVFAVVLE